jgi:hypothetical protein
LLQVRGVSGIPLSYIVRESAALPGVDAGYGIPTSDEEMIKRGAHTGTQSQCDSITVWNVIHHITYEGPVWSWANQFQRLCGNPMLMVETRFCLKY